MISSSVVYISFIIQIIVGNLGGGGGGVGGHATKTMIYKAFEDNF